MPAAPPRPRIELLGREHDRAGFICGKEALDRYFQQQVTQDARRHLATPFVMIIPDGAIGGFYTLSSTALRLQELPEDIAKRLPRYPLVPATLIGRLAIDRRSHGQGWGNFLLLDALHRCATTDIASFAVVVTRSTTRRGPSICMPASCRCPIRLTVCSGG